MADNRRGGRGGFQRRNPRRNTPFHNGQNPSDNAQTQNVPQHNQTIPQRQLGFKYFENLLNEIPMNIISFLCLDKQKIKQLLTKGTIKSELFQRILKVFARACKCTQRQNLTRFLQEFDSESFVMQIQKYIIWFHARPITIEQIDSIGDLLDFLLVYKETLVTNGGNTFFLLSPTLKEALEKIKQQHPDKIGTISKKFDSMEESKTRFLEGFTEQEVNKLKKEENLKINDPPSNFRDIPVLPTPEDLIDIHPFLRINLSKGKFEDVDHYLDVQFRLLREDFLKPLREGIIEFKISSKYMNKKKDFYVKDLRIYNGISFIKTVNTEGGILNVIKFDITKFKKINWETSKRLIHGSLVCFSKDNFETMFCGTVVGRKVPLLKEGYLEIQLDNLTEDTLNELLLTSYTMLETQAYFEAYKHNLKGLQFFTSETFPFKKYIVDVNKTITPPAYLNVNTAFNFSSLLKGFAKLNYQSVNVLDKNKWPKANELGLDNAQFLAFQGALTKEFAIIQGPPGTGKTFLGLKIVQLIIQNSAIWNRDNAPILIVCYTNHALDQFLEGIQSFTPNIVRVGGRCQSAALKDFQINEVRRQMHDKRQMDFHIHRNISDTKMELRGIERQINEIDKIVQMAFTAILPLSYLDKLTKKNHYDELARPHMSLIKWLELDYLNANKYEENLMYHGQAHVLENINGELEEEPSNEEVDMEFINAMRDIDLEDFRHNYDVLKEIAKTNPENIPTTLKKKNTPKKQDIIKNLLNHKDFMRVEEENRIGSIFRLDLKDKWRLYRLWISRFAKANYNKIKTIQKKYIDLSRQLKEFRMMEDINIIKKAEIVGMTTTGAAKYSYIISEINFRIVIVEEAAEVLEAHILTSLSNKTQHLVLIGDHQQLRPSPTVYKLAKDFNLDLSLFERMINNGLEYHQLVMQHRMRPCISQLLVPHIYKNLQDHESVKAYEPIRGFASNMYFITHEHEELKVEDSRSRRNLFEAEYLAATCKYLILQGYTASQITILTAYSGQMFAIKSLIRPNPLLNGVRVTVVDNFQGEENDIILISFVRSNEEEVIGFLKIANRVCVALSRARKGLYCVGNFKLLAKQSTIWKHILAYLETNNYIGNALQLRCQNHPETITEIKSAEDFSKVAEGGCTLLCKFRLECGHGCTNICHPYDPEHKQYNCKRPCEKTLCSLKHKCTKQCYVECGPCAYMMPKIIPDCRHEVKMKCSQLPETFSCRFPCRNILSCGHKCSRRCSDLVCECSDKISVLSPCGHSVEIRCKNKETMNEKLLLEQCRNPCLKELPCGHICSGTCSECCNQRIHIPCQDRCTRMLICGHMCKSPCSQNCPPCNVQPCVTKCQHSRCQKPCGVPCDPCVEKCDWQCSHHKCTGLCDEECTRPPCDIPCPKKLKCDHPCMGFCGEPCPNLCGECNKEELRDLFLGYEEEENARFVALKDCGHVIESVGLELWLKQEKTEEILFKDCPKCKTTITRNYRFGNIIKKIIKNVEEVKNRTYGTKAEVKNLRKDLDKDHNSLLSDPSIPFLPGSFTICIKSNFNKLFDSKRFLHMDKSKLTMLLQLVSFLKEIILTLNKFQTTKPILYVQNYRSIPPTDAVKSAISAELCKSLKDHANECFNIILVTINKNVLGTLYPYQINDIAFENERLKLIIQAYHYLNSFSLHPKAVNNFQDLVKRLQVRAAFNEEAQDKVRKIFKEATQITGLGISLEEKSQILSALNMSKGHWFKCPNGHIYVITECGGATQEGKCNECNATIGGLNHALNADNQFAPEMDGAPFPAFSNQANILNFNFDNLL